MRKTKSSSTKRLIQSEHTINRGSAHHNECCKGVGKPDLRLLQTKDAETKMEDDENRLEGEM